MKQEYVAPTFEADAFHCPSANCGVYAHQEWGRAYSKVDTGSKGVEGISVSYCARCGAYALWLNDAILYPTASIAPLWTDDMPEDVAADYKEARDIVARSPRAACALLRLALQKLMPHLGGKGKHLDDDIGALVKKGLPERLQQALDGVRVIGNNAVHPGEIDLKDDADTAVALFHILNMIVDVVITQQKRVAEVYSKVPSASKDAIRRRDESQTS